MTDPTDEPPVDANERRARRGGEDDGPPEWVFDDYDRPLPSGVPFREARDQLLEKANVHGHGIGPKFSDGERTADISVRVYVDEKVSEADLDEADLIPPAFEGVPTDVIAEDVPEPEANYRGNRGQNVFRPAVTGLLAHSPSSWGSYSLWRRANGDQVALTNRHIAADTDEDPSGVAFHQTEYDNTFSNQFATFDEAGAFYPGSGEKACDTAVGPLEDGNGDPVTGTRTVMPGDFELGNWVRPRLSRQYINIGYRTGVTGGLCVDLDKTVNVDHGFDTLTYEGVYQFGTYSAGGDSGSLTGTLDWESGRFHPVGVHFASNGHVIPYHSHVRPAHGPLYPIGDTYRDITGSGGYNDYADTGNNHYEGTLARSWLNGDDHLELRVFLVASDDVTGNDSIPITDGHGGAILDNPVSGTGSATVDTPPLSGMSSQRSITVPAAYLGSDLAVGDHFDELIASDSSVYNAAQTEFETVNEGAPTPTVSYEFEEEWTGDNTQYRGVDISPDGSYFAYVGTNRQEVEVYQMDGTPVTTISEGVEPAGSCGPTLEFSRGGDYLAAVWWDSSYQLTVYNTDDWSTELEWDFPSSSNAMGISFGPNNRFAVAEFSGSFRVWEEPYTDWSDYNISTPSTVYSIGFSHGGDYLAYGMSNGNVVLREFQPDDGSNLTEVVFDKNISSNNVSGVGFSSDDEYLYAGTWDNEFFVYDTITGEEVYSDTSLNGSVYSIQSHPDGYVVFGEGAGSGARGIYTLEEGTWTELDYLQTDEVHEELEFYPEGDGRTRLAAATRNGVMAYFNNVHKYVNSSASSSATSTATGNASRPRDAAVTASSVATSTATGACNYTSGGSLSATTASSLQPTVRIGLEGDTDRPAFGWAGDTSFPTRTRTVSSTPSAVGEVSALPDNLETLLASASASATTDVDPSAAFTLAGDAATVATAPTGPSRVRSVDTTADASSTFLAAPTVPLWVVGDAEVAADAAGQPTHTIGGVATATTDSAALSASPTVALNIFGFAESTGFLSGSHTTVVLASGTFDAVTEASVTPSRRTNATPTATAVGSFPGVNLGVGFAPIVGKAGTIEATLVFVGEDVIATNAEGVAHTVGADIGRLQHPNED